MSDSTSTGAPRVAWAGAYKGRSARVVIVSEANAAGAIGEFPVVEVYDGVDATGVDRWRRPLEQEWGDVAQAMARGLAGMPSAAKAG